MTDCCRFVRHLPAKLICIATLSLIIVVLGSIGWLWRERFLVQIADFWTVSDPVYEADAVVILGGGVYDKSKIAADLYRRGLTKKILVSDVLDSSHAIVGGHYSDTTLSREALRGYGIPDEAVETFGTVNKNTRNEAVALRDWIAQKSAASFIIPTEFLFSRRVRWIFNREFAGRNVQISIYPFETSHYNRNDWWRTEEGKSAFELELIKFIYYRIRY
jgi:hypothetical protein